MRRVSNEEFARLLAEAGITQAHFAHMVCMRPENVTHWKSAPTGVPSWVRSWLMLFARQRSTQAAALAIDEANARAHNQRT